MQYDVLIDIEEKSSIKKRALEDKDFLRTSFLREKSTSVQKFKIILPVKELDKSLCFIKSFQGGDHND